MAAGKNRILVLGRIQATNYGDVVIADCCAHILNRIIDSENKGFFKFKKIPHVKLANVNKLQKKIVKSNVTNFDKIVFPGGGINSMKVTDALLARLDTGRQLWYYFNAIGIHPERHYEKLAVNIETILNDGRVRQVTTRGDLSMAKEYITAQKPYPIEWIVDPAIWTNEVYGIEKKPDSDLIGIGPIRPEIFNEQDKSVSVDEVFSMYEKLLAEADKRGYHWKLFCNGTEPDFAFAQELLQRFGYNEAEHLVRKPENARQLVEDIAEFKGVIAARFHANIISTSLSIPSVALVWNVKMRGFSELIGCQDRYIEGMDKLLDADFLLDKLEAAMKEGYDAEKIRHEKDRAYRTLENIVKDK